MQHTGVFELADEGTTDRFGAALARVLPPRACIGLSGTLGAGKTRLVQAVAAAVGVPRDEVVSPTFVLCQQYGTTQRIHHLDVYRLRDEDEWFELGVEELFQSDAWTFIEWAERFRDLLPEDRFELELEVTSPTSRRATLTATGNAPCQALDRLEEAYGRE